MVVASLSFGSLAWARECYDTDLAQYYANQEGYRVARHYDGERNVRVTVASCDFNPYSERYTINMYTFWDGSITGNTYNVDGTLQINLDGSDADFVTTYKSQSVIDWQTLKFWWHTGIHLIDSTIDYSR